ncbi:unnamed protein product, partial [marine sediment metagenome]
CLLQLVYILLGMATLMDEHDFPFRPGNCFHLLINGQRFFPVMLDAIRAASHLIVMEMYLVESGGIASQFSSALIEAGITGTSYWFNSYMLQQVDAIHDYLDQLPESGKVLSITTAMRMLGSLDERAERDDFFLSILYKKLPDEIMDSLFTPYMSADGNQLRFSIRVYESDESLRREQLLQKIRQHLTTEIGLEEEQVHVSGMLVLYNNMLQSLFRSQILTLG